MSTSRLGICRAEHVSSHKSSSVSPLNQALGIREPRQCQRHASGPRTSRLKLPISGYVQRGLDARNDASLVLVDCHRGVRGLPWHAPVLDDRTRLPVLSVFLKRSFRSRTVVHENNFLFRCNAGVAIPLIIEITPKKPKTIDNMYIFRLQLLNE
jgi:hypothetical protein